MLSRSAPYAINVTKNPRRGTRGTVSPADTFTTRPIPLRHAAIVSSPVLVDGVNSFEANNQSKNRRVAGTCGSIRLQSNRSYRSNGESVRRRNESSVTHVTPGNRKLRATDVINARSPKSPLPPTRPSIAPRFTTLRSGESAGQMSPRFTTRFNTRIKSLSVGSMRLKLQ